MDNATKAIVMVGSVLIAIAVISVAIYAFTTARGFANSSEEVLSATQVQSFNRFYNEYKTNSSGTIRCIDAINILNRAIEDNVKCDVSAGNIIKLKDGVYTADSKNFTGKKFKYSLEYDAVGKVNKVKISSSGS